MIFILFFGECLNFRENMRCFCAKTFFFSESILELCSGPCPREDLSSESRYLAFALDFFVPLASTLCPRLHLCHVQNKPFAFSGKLCDACVRASSRPNFRRYALCIRNFFLSDLLQILSNLMAVYLWQFQKQCVP